MYNGSVDAAVKILQTHNFSGLYRGFMATWGRESIGQMAFFTTYEFILRQSVSKTQKVSEAPLWASLIGGTTSNIQAE